MAQLVVNVAAAILCLLCATATARQLTQTPPSSSTNATDCYLGVSSTNSRTGAEDDNLCALASVGVSASTCQAAGQSGKENNLYNSSALVCALPIPYACGNLSVTGRVSKCPSAVQDTVINLLQQANAANHVDATILNTNGNTIAAGGTLLTALGSQVQLASASAPAPSQRQSSTTPPASPSGSTFVGGGSTPASPSSTASPASTTPPAGTNTGSTFVGGGSTPASPSSTASPASTTPPSGNSGSTFIG